MHITRLSGSKNFRLQQHPTTTFARKWAELRVRCGNEAPWDLRRNLYRRVVVRPTELGNPHQTRGFHIPTATTATAPVLAVKPTPLKSRALSDSCTEPKKESGSRPAILQNLRLYFAPKVQRLSRSKSGVSVWKRFQSAFLLQR